MTPPLPERLIEPSLLAADFSRLGEEVRRMEQAGADWLHWDVMDGDFVPNLSFGPPVISALRPLVQLPFEVQLMVRRPARLVAAAAKAGAQRITVHVESEHEGGDLRATLRRIREAGCRTGLALNPETPLEQAAPFLEEIDLLLVMTVHPGFGGQAFLPAMVEKIEAAHARRAAQGLAFRIEVDGGIQPSTAAAALRAGCDTLVCGTYLFLSDDPAKAVRELRQLPGRQSPRAGG